MKKRVAVLIMLALSSVLCVAALDEKDDSVKKDVKKIAWKAYTKATGLGVLAEEGPKIVGEFTLDRDVSGLGKKEDKIHEVRFVVFGGSRTRGLILVNQKTKEALVVFPKKKTTTKQAPGGDALKAVPEK